MNPLTHSPTHPLTHFCKSHSIRHSLNASVLVTSILTCLLLLASHLAIGQVRSAIIQDGEDIGGIVPYYQPNDQMQSILLPEVDVEAALLADREAGIQIPRFAVQIPTNFSKSDGVTEEFYGKIVWKMGFHSIGATGLNFKLAEVNLPEEAEIYLFSKDGRMVFGPIESNVINSNTFYTEIIKGD
ncbi:MAG: hypothetical protein LH618_10170, partial [Saprospiraceae bacterium]|nr:hypothetical protein [Saprospiraceae bacterium]